MLIINIVVPYNNLLVYKNFYTQCNYSMSEPLNFVIYVDSTECSSCYLGVIQKWEPLMNSLRLNYNFIRTTILLAPQKETQADFFEKLEYTKFRYPLYIDTCNIFSQTNKFIPAEKMYHTFLLDENGRVILVGNPLKNEEIKNMFHNILEERKSKMRHKANPAA